MSNRTRSKRLSRKLDNSIMKDFTELRDAGEVQTGPKRRRTKERTPSKSVTPPSFLKDINELRKGAFEVGDVTPHPSCALHLTFNSDPNSISEGILASSKSVSSQLSSPASPVSTTMPPSPTHLTSTPCDSIHHQTTQLSDTLSSRHLSSEPYDTNSLINPTSLSLGPSSSTPQIINPSIFALSLNHSSTPPRSTHFLHHNATPHNPSASLSSTSPLCSTHTLGHTSTPHNPATSLSPISTPSIPTTLLSSTSTPSHGTHSMHQTATPSNPISIHNSTSLDRADPLHEIVMSPNFTMPGVVPPHNTCSLHQTARSADSATYLSQSSALPSAPCSLHRISISSSPDTSMHLSTTPTTSLNSRTIHLSAHSSHITSTPLEFGTTLHSVTSPDSSLAIRTPMILRSVLRTKSSSQRQSKRLVSFHNFVAVKEFNPTNPTQGTSQGENRQEDEQQWELDEQNSGYVSETTQITPLDTNEEQSPLEDDAENDVLIDTVAKNKIPQINGRKEEEEEEEDDEDSDFDDEYKMLPLNSEPGGVSLPLTQQRTRKDKIATKTQGHVEQNRRRNQASSLNLSRSILRNIFQHHLCLRVSKEAVNVIMKFSQLYLNQVAKDLAAYAQHAGRHTLEVEDAVLLLKRQGFLSDRTSFDYLVNSQLPLEYVQQLLPCAQSGKRIVP